MTENLATRTADHIKTYPNRLSRADNLRLFLGIAFLFHLWTIYQVFNDIEWVAARTQPGDAFGYAAYSMSFTLLESAVVFSLVWLIGALLPSVWQGKQLTAILIWGIWGIIFWAAAGQISESLPEDSLPLLVGWFFSTGHPLWFAYLLRFGTWGLVTAFVGVPLLAFLRSERARQVFTSFLDRTNVLATIFIGLDVIGLITIVIRNLSY